MIFFLLLCENQLEHREILQSNVTGCEMLGKSELFMFQ